MKESNEILFEQVKKPDYCIDMIGDCGDCQQAPKNSPKDCQGNNKRFLASKLPTSNK